MWFLHNYCSAFLRRESYLSHDANSEIYAPCLTCREYSYNYGNDPHSDMVPITQRNNSSIWSLQFIPHNDAVSSKENQASLTAFIVYVLEFYAVRLHFQSESAGLLWSWQLLRFIRINGFVVRVLWRDNIPDNIHTDWYGSWDHIQCKPQYVYLNDICIIVCYHCGCAGSVV